MNQRFSAFMAVAQTLSIRKAAEMDFVSYQCISGHIRSLEEEYKVRLFDRSPHFALTADGRTLLEALQKIKLIEDGIAQAFDDQGENVCGHVTLGVPMSRYTEIVPPLLARFHKEYPRVELEIVHDYSNVLQQQVQRGMLDMAIVVQQSPEPNPKLDSLVLLREMYLFLVSVPLLQSVLGSDWEAQSQKYKKRGIPLAELARFPIVSYPTGSRLRTQLEQAAAQYGLHYNTVFASNRAETFDAIARTDTAGCIISHQLYGITARKNQHMRREHRLQSYRIDFGKFSMSSAITLIRNQDSVMAAYKQHLIQIICEHFAGYDQLVRKI